MWKRRWRHGCRGLRGRHPAWPPTGCTRRCAMRCWAGASGYVRCWSTRPASWWAPMPACWTALPVRWNSSTSIRWCMTTCRPWTTTTCAGESPRCIVSMAKPWPCWWAMRCRRWPSRCWWRLWSKATRRRPGCRQPRWWQRWRVRRARGAWLAARRWTSRGWGCGFHAPSWRRCTGPRPGRCCRSRSSWACWRAASRRQIWPRRCSAMVGPSGWPSRWWTTSWT